MRNRGRVIINTPLEAGPFTAVALNYPNRSLIQTTYGVQRSLHASVQSYADETISDDDSSSRAMKGVEHYKYSIERDSLPLDEYRSGNYIYQLYGVNAHWESWGDYARDLSRENIRVIWPKTEDALLQEAKEKFYEENQVDNLVNVIESPELVSYGRSILRLVKLGLGAKARIIKKVVFTPGSDAKIVRRLAVNSSLKKSRFTKLPMNGRYRSVSFRGAARGAISTISGLHLGWSFGVAPIVSDMRKMSRAVASYKKRLHRAIASAGTEVSVHAKCIGSIQPFLGANKAGALPVGYSIGPDNGYYWTTLPEKDGNPLRVATVRGRRTVRFNSDVFSRLDYLMSTFGGTGPASLAWELLPYSFVLDWFVDLSDVLNSIDNALTGSSKDIKDAVVSTKWEVKCPIIHTRINSTNTCIYDDVQVADVRLSSYTRKPVNPTFQVGLSGRFGKKQALLTASLIGQLVANLKALR